MRKIVAVVGGKVALFATRLRGGGSAFPGLVAEKLDPNFLTKVLSSLPYGVVLISGTNGKTTTTKMVADLLRGQGLRVFTNPTGSNFTRGVAASLLAELGLAGRLKADVAVLELDEAHAVHFVRKVAPRYSLLLNVMRDQLDRFGEIDNTARLLESIVRATTDTVVLNREDPLISALAAYAGDAQVQYFGLSDELVERFPSDDVLYGGGVAARDKPAALVTLEKYSGGGADFSIAGHNGARRNDATLAHRDAAQNHRAGSDPGVVTDFDRLRIQGNVARVATGKDLLRLLVPHRCLERMGQIVEYIDTMGNQNPVTDLDRSCRPDARTYADITPFANRNPPAVTKDHQLAPDMRMRANDDVVTVAQRIADSRGVTEEGAWLQPAGGPADQSLNPEMQIDAVNCMRAIARDRNQPCHRIPSFRHADRTTVIPAISIPCKINRNL